MASESGRFSQAPESRGNPYANEQYVLQLLAKAVAAKASDVHLKVGHPPGARVRGELVFFRADSLRPQDTEAIARLLIKDPKMKEQVTSLREYDTAFNAPNIGRFRVNIYRQRDSLAIVMRAIPQQIPAFEELGLPA